MKYSILIVAFCFSCLIAGAQTIKQAQVPSAVVESFSKLYPGAKVEKWEKEGSNYEAEFDNGKVETSVTFDAGGAVIETEVEVPASELPVLSKEYLAKNLPGKKIKEVSRITDSAGVNTYEAEVGETDYVFDASGNLIKQVSEDKKD